MKSLFVMDPLHRINVAGDSTYMLMREHSDRGEPAYFCTPADLYGHNGRCRGVVTPVRTTAQAPHFHLGEPVDLDVGEAFDVVWMRKDPPFDMTYIFTTYLLDLAAKDAMVVNHPSGLKLFNEKMWVMERWPELQPKTLVSNNIATLRAWLSDLGTRGVIKPWDGNGGRGVLVVEPGDRNLSSMLELLTREGSEYVIAQQYIEGVEQGDKRILIFDGEPVGAINRIPQSADHRANMHAGGRVERVDLDARDQQICDALAEPLREHGMIFVGIDIIDGMLTEVNVTSPTGIQEINRLDGVRLEADLIDRVARKLGE